ncbi:MAG: cytochrome c-type biogenesis protein CcmH [Rhodospirillales bacterium]|nr:MAG: cytochrome c-type biogenesis protein CcmH [Rhodospirillales bacterium]
MRRRLVKAVVVLVAILLMSGTGQAGGIQPDEILADPALEARAREIGRELRCLVCQNQSIDDSNAELARDMRILVRARLQASDTDREVLDYVVSRYGDFVRLRPPFKASTLLLWFGPALILAAGGLAMVLFVRRRAGIEDSLPPLSEVEQARLEALLGDRPR